MPTKGGGSGLLKRRAVSYDQHNAFTDNLYKSSATPFFSVSATQAVVPYPADLAVGDYILLQTYGPVAPISPSGYTLLSQASAAAPNFANLYYRLATAADVTAAAGGTGTLTVVYGTVGVIVGQMINAGPQFGVPTAISTSAVAITPGTTSVPTTAGYSTFSQMLVGIMRSSASSAFTAGGSIPAVNSLTNRQRTVSSDFQAGVNGGSATLVANSNTTHAATARPISGFTQSPTGTMVFYYHAFFWPTRATVRTALVYNPYFAVNPTWSEMFASAPFRASQAVLFTQPFPSSAVQTWTADIGVGPVGQEIVVASALPLHFPSLATSGTYAVPERIQIPVTVAAGSRVCVRLLSEAVDSSTNYNGSISVPARLELLG